MRKPFLQPRQPSSTEEHNMPETRQIYSVSQLNRKVKRLLEGDIGSVWIEGELSNFIKATSGHWYFTLKDSSAQIKCALFKFKNSRIDFSPLEGDKVVVKGKISLYEARGDYQLIADFMEPAGLGNLQRQLNETINKLKAEGLFDVESKQPLPKYPKRIGVITSPTGAAIQDVLTVLKRRCPMIPVIIYPTQVQGINAIQQVIDALNVAESRNECDVILITRGGGSLEDLWSFNDEKLARKIADYSIPIIAAIGHEVDTTVTELVADLRAATPSAAAELLSPDQNALAQKIDILEQNLKQTINSRIKNSLQLLKTAKLKLKTPQQQLEKYIHQLENLDKALKISIHYYLDNKSQQIERLNLYLNQRNPKYKLKENTILLESLKNGLNRGIHASINTKKYQLADIVNQLNILSPLSTLARGYSITRDKKSGAILSKKVHFHDNQELKIILSDGEVKAKVMR